MSNHSFSLVVCIPGEEPVRHDLTAGEITFGRSPENQLQVLVAEVSVRHGRLVLEGEGYRIIDQGSTNGTTVNGAPVGPDGVVLKPMDRLVLGTVVSAYYVPVAVLATSSPADLVASLSAVSPEASPKTAPVAIAAPAAAAPSATPVRPAVSVPQGPAAPASPGGTTVRLEQVRSTGVRPAPAPTAPRQPLPGPPAGGPPKAPAAPAAPGKPTVGMPPKAPGVAPLKPPAPGQPSRPPVAPPAGGAPGAPQTLPLKRPAPSSPTIPLPKMPPKPGQ